RAGLEADRQFLRARILQVERMGASLRAVADNGDLLALDEVQVCVTIIINTHARSSFPFSMFPFELSRLAPVSALPRKGRRTAASHAPRRGRYPVPSASAGRP